MTFGDIHYEKTCHVTSYDIIWVTTLFLVEFSIK